MKKIYFFILFTFFSLSLIAQKDQDTLKIGVYDSPPFVIMKNNKISEGVSVWIWEKIKPDINQPYKFVTYTNEHPLPDILKDLENGEIDFSINPLTITHDRYSNIDFTYPFYNGNLTIAQKGFSNISSITSIFGSIFSYRLLYLLLILAFMVVLFGLIIWLTERRNHHFESGVQGLFSSFWWSAVTMTTVGYGDKVPISNFGRLIAFLWMLCSIVIISIFTASITSNLTVHKLANSNLTIEDFKQSKVGSVTASASEEFLKRNFFKNTNYYPAFTKGLEALKNESIDVFIYDEPWLDYQLHNNDDFEELSLVPIRFEVQPYAIPLRKNLNKELKVKINSSLLSLTETHDWHLLLKEYQLEQY